MKNHIGPHTRNSSITSDSSQGVENIINGWNALNSGLYKGYVEKMSKGKLRTIMLIIYLFLILIGQFFYWPLDIHEKYY